MPKIWFAQLNAQIPDKRKYQQVRRSAQISLRSGVLKQSMSELTFAATRLGFGCPEFDSTAESIEYTETSPKMNFFRSFRGCLLELLPSQSETRIPPIMPDNNDPNPLGQNLVEDVIRKPIQILPS